MVYNPNFDQPPLSGDEIVLTNEPRGRTTTGEIAGLVRYPRVIAGTTGTVLASDRGQGIQCTNASAVTLTVPAGLGAFSCYIVQSGAGAVTPTASGTTINSNGSLTATNGQYAVCSLIATAADVFVFAGDRA